MNETYPATYRDSHGEESTFLHNDGKTLQMKVRGVEFSGERFDDFTAEDTELALLTDFNFNLGDLCDYSLKWTMPIPISENGNMIKATLRGEIILGVPTERGWIDRQDVTFSLDYNGKTFQSNGKSGWFETELLEIQKALPPGILMKACITCALSDYSPYRHSLFGCLACFRGNQKAYLEVNNKYDLFAVWDTLTEFVQETYLCPQFLPRQKGAGYRG